MDDYHNKKVEFLYTNEFKLKDELQRKYNENPDKQHKTPENLLAKLILDFTQAENLLSFKDTYKKFRKALKEHPDLLENEDYRPYLIELIRAFCKETFLSPTRDVKGLINDLIQSLLSNEYYAAEIRNTFAVECHDFLEKFLEESQLAEEKMKDPEWVLDIDAIDVVVRVLNFFGDVIHGMADENSDELVHPFIKAHVTILKQMTTSFENTKHISVKFLSVMAEELRNCINVVLGLKDHIIGKIAADDADLKVDLMTISLACRVYLCSINRMNHETASQCSILAVIIDSIILKVNDEEFENFHLAENEINSPFSTRTYIQTGDNLKMKRLSIIRSLLIYKQNFNIFENFKTLNETPFSIILHSCLEPNTNLKHYTFKTLNLVLEVVNQRDYLRERLFEDSKQHMELFDLLLKNWESPIKGVTHITTEVFQRMVTIIETKDTRQRNKALTQLKEKIMTMNIGNSRKKYNALIVLINHIDVEALLNEYPSFLYELLSSSGDVHLSASSELFEKILNKLHQKILGGEKTMTDEKFIKWTRFWINDFLLCLEKEEFNVIRGIMTHITPAICNINLAASAYLINLLMQKDLSKKNNLWCFVSLLKSARANYLIEYTAGQQAYQLKENISGIKTDLTIEVPFIKRMMLNGNRNINLSILELITSAPKPAEIPAVFEYILTTNYLQYNLRTSYSDFRNNTITVLKKFFIRIRTIYDANLLKHFPLNNENVTESDIDTLTVKQAKLNFKPMLNFLKNIFNLLTHDLRPDAEHETIFPVIEILKLIFQIFGLKDYAYKKTLVFKGVSVLHYIDAFNANFFNFLLLCHRSTWDLVRLSAQEILMAFPDNYRVITPEYLHNSLLPSAVELTKNPVIRNAEGGALLLALVARKFGDKVDFTRLEETKSINKDMLPSLKLSYYVLALLEKRFENMQKHFLEDQAEYCNNLIHGLITTLGFLIQELPKGEELKLPENNKAFRQFFHDLSQVMGRVLSYATKLSADNISTCILDNNATVKKFNEVQVNKSAATDCRGHIISDKPEDPQILTKLKNIENILYGNTLMETMEDDSGFDTENIVVVSFYLITRESGLLFTNLSNLILGLDVHNANIIDFEDLQLLVNTYFHALLNLKHLGSIDRIAHGLSILCKSMYETKNPILPNLAEELLDRIMNALEQGDFKNVLRRSAGIPPAIICLLKSEPYGKKSRLFPKVMKKLFELTEKGKNEDIRVHALNVLKFVFQDSNLRADIEAYISQGFIAAIKGFSTSDWVIRNSALMLFSSIAKRTIGTEKVSDQQSVKNSINIVEFFTRGPDLVDFFLKEVQDYVQKDVQTQSLYPSLYPIALIMTRLLPYDLKNNYLRRAVEVDRQQDEIKQAEGEEDGEQEVVKERRKFVTMEELGKFLPLFVKAAHNKNYMGRLMCARAVLPFIPYESIVDQVIDLLDLDSLREISVLKSDHNFAHGLLLQVYYVIKNHFKLQESYPNEANRFKEKLPVLINELSERRFILIYVQCPLIPVVYIQIMKKLLKYIPEDASVLYEEVFAYLYGYCLQMFKEDLKQNVFRITRDFGSSTLRLKHLQYSLIYDRIVNKNLDAHKELLQLFVEKYRTTFALRKKDDNEPFRVLLTYWNKYFKLSGNTLLTRQEKISVVTLLCQLLDENEFICTEFLPCVSEMLAIILNIGCRDILSSNQTIALLRCLDKLYLKFPQNARLMKIVIKLYGSVLPLYLQQGSQVEGNFLTTYNSICDKYSHATQIDSLRIAVIKSFKLSLKPLMDSVKDFDTFLSFSKVIIRLLQDEIPEIRSKMADFVSRVFHIEEDSRFQFKYSPNYILEVFFNYILQRYESWSPEHNKLALNHFILTYVFESEFDKYKELAHYEKRIFAVDKPNKFYSDLVPKRIAHDVYLKMITKKIVSQYDLETFLDSQNYKFKEASEKYLDRYLSDVINRNEFLFDCMLKRLYQDAFYKRFEGTESHFMTKVKENADALEPYLRTLLQ